MSDLAMGSFTKLFVFIMAAGLLSGVYLKNRAATNVDSALPKQIAAIKASLPKMIAGDVLELQDISYENRTIHYDVLSKRWFDMARLHEEDFNRNVRTEYCTGKDKFALAKVSLDYLIRIPPQTLNDRMSSTHVILHPQDCN